MSITRAATIVIAALVIGLLVPVAVAHEPGGSPSPDEFTEPPVSDPNGAAPVGDEPPPHPPDEPTDLDIQWDLRADSPDQLAAESSALVEVDVQSVEPSEPYDAGAQVLPTQEVTVRTTETLLGWAPASFALWKIGTDDVYGEGDPPYEVGQRYLIFIRPKLLPDGSPEGSFIPASPDGRLEETASGEVEPLIEGPVAEEVAGMTPEEVADAAAG